jgi:hypothetical protein
MPNTLPFNQRIRKVRLEGDRGFESSSLHRGVSCELDFRAALGCGLQKSAHSLLRVAVIEVVGYRPSRLAFWRVRVPAGLPIEWLTLPNSRPRRLSPASQLPDGHRPARYGQLGPGILLAGASSNSEAEQLVRCPCYSAGTGQCPCGRQITEPDQQIRELDDQDRAPHASLHCMTHAELFAGLPDVPQPWTARR